MAGLEATLRIGAVDDTAKALAALKAHVEAVQKSVMVLDKFVGTAAKVTRATDPLASSISNAQRAISDQRAELAGLIDGLDRIVGPTEKAAGAQRQLARQVEITTGALVRQGEAAERAGVRVHSGARHAGGAEHGMGMAPFAGPSIEHAVIKTAEAGATVAEEIARLKAAGATASEISKAQADFRGFSRTHSGVLEADYLAAFRDARVIAPGESHEMTQLGARYRTALRNSGISSSEFDVGNVLRIMDELGLQTGAQREDFLNNFLKAQQVFGSQITTETALAAYRNAKQSIYSWSPEFRDKYFPTLLQASGQQGGTEMMTALNNYIGHHMSKTEIQALVKSGFVRPQDVVTDHGRTTFRDNAKLFEEDLFTSNIAKWAWDFHSSYLERKGSTEKGFNALIAKMPRNMAGLIAFLTHNEARLKRNAGEIDPAVGLLAAGDNYLAQNPVAGLAALRDAIEQFAASVSLPAMSKVGAGLQGLAHGIQTMAEMYGDFAHRHPALAKDLGLGAGVGGAAAGGWLSWRLLSGVGSYFGFGAGGGGAVAAGATGPLAALAAIGYELGAPDSALRVYMQRLLAHQQPYKISDDWATTGDWRTRVSYAHQADLHPIIRGERDMETARAAAMATLDQHGPLQVHGQATISGTIRVEASSNLLRIVDQAVSVSQQMALNPLQGGHVGRMDSDAAPLGHGGAYSP